MIHAKPIGYWLKVLDSLIETAFDEAFDEHGVVRRHWQVLNVLSGGPHDRASLAEALRPFWTADSLALDEVLAALRTRGWLREQAGTIRLSPSGEAAHAAIAQRVNGIRARVTDGVSPPDYETTVRTLERMTANLRDA